MLLTTEPGDLVLDQIVAKHEPIIAARLEELNAALQTHAEARSRGGRN